jgi:hypothetical protein
LYLENYKGINLIFRIKIKLSKKIEIIKNFLLKLDYEEQNILEYLLNNHTFNEYFKLDEIITKINNPSIIKLPKMYNNPLANLFPKFRSRIGFKIYKNNILIIVIYAIKFIHKLLL